MKSQDLKLSRLDLLLLFYHYQRESTSFPLYPEVIRLIRGGENVQAVLQKKLGLTPKSIQQLRQFQGSQEDFPQFLTQLNKMGLLSPEEVQSYLTPVKPLKTNPWGILAMTIVVLISGVYLFQGDSTEEVHDSSENLPEKDVVSTTDSTTKNKASGTDSNSALNAQHLEEAFKTGKLLLNEKRYEEAYPHLKKVIDLEDPTGKYYVEKATACFLLNKLEWGEHFAAQALKNGEETAALFKIWGQILLAQEKNAEGLAHLEKSLSLEQKDPDILMLLAETYRKSDQHEKALLYLQQFLQLYPEEITALKIQARILIAQGKEEESAPLLEKIIQNEEKPDPEFLSLLTDHYRKKGELESAKKVVEKALQQRPEDADLLNLSGEILEQLGQIEVAMERFKLACKLDPESVRAQLNCAAIFQIQKKEEEALKIYEVCLDKNPNLELARYNRFILWMKQEKNDQALTDLAYLEKQFPRHPLTIQALHLLGAKQYSQKEYEQSQNTFEKILKIQNNDEEALLRHGMCALKLKRYDLVLDDFEYLLQLNPQHPKKALLEQILQSFETSKE